SENDEEGITFATHIKELSEKKAIIHPPAPLIAATVKPYLKNGTLLGAVSYGRRGQIIFYPDILYELSNGLVGYCIRLPQEYEPVPQRRKHVRVAMRIPIKVERMT